MLPKNTEQMQGELLPEFLCSSNAGGARPCDADNEVKGISSSHTACNSLRCAMNRLLHPQKQATGINRTKEGHNRRSFNHRRPTRIECRNKRRVAHLQALGMPGWHRASNLQHSVCQLRALAGRKLQPLPQKCLQICIPHILTI